MKQVDPIKYCPNCATENQAGAVYCSSCGQKFEQAKVRFWPMVGIFLYSLFNADSTLWRTLRDIWIPARLTRAYFSGKRRKYFHPARLFFFSWVLFFALFTMADSNIFDAEPGFSLVDAHKEKMEGRRVIEDLIQFRDSLSKLDTLSVEIINRQIAMISSARFKELDTENIDTVYKFLKTTYDTITLTKILNPGLKIDMDDLVNLSDEEIIEKYEITGFVAKLIGRQVLKMSRETNLMINYLVKGVSWMVFFLIPSISLILYLMYFYKGHFFVEHLVFTLHSHSFLFVGCIFIWLLDYAINFIPSFRDESWLDLSFLFIPVLLWALLHPLIGLRTYYKSRWVGVIFKSATLVFLYFFLATTSMLLALILRFLVF